ncbi:MAG: NAD(P)-dependent oxidoreductase [Pseudomonadota bacterium]
MEKVIGFIGLGEMGLPMAKNLIKAGYGLNIFDTNKRPLMELEKLGAHVLNSSREVARSSKIVMVMVRTPDEVREVIAGKEGLLTEAAPSSIILIMSTIDAGTAQEMSRLAGEKEVIVLDCPVSGGSPGAEAATLTIIAGGPEEVLESCKPILEVMGKNIFYLGEIGMGESAKLINNLLLGIYMSAAYEAVALAKKAGVKMDVLFDLLKVSTGNSWIIQHWDMVNSWKEHYVEGGSLDLLYKDIRLALAMGESLKVPLHISALCNQLRF